MSASGIEPPADFAWQTELVRLTVLGCSGSVVGPDSPASGYLLTAPDTTPLWWTSVAGYWAHYSVTLIPTR